MQRLTKMKCKTFKVTPIKIILRDPDNLKTYHKINFIKAQQHVFWYFRSKTRTKTKPVSEQDIPAVTNDLPTFYHVLLFCYQPKIFVSELWSWGFNKLIDLILTQYIWTLLNFASSTYMSKLWSLHWFPFYIYHS